MAIGIKNTKVDAQVPTRLWATRARRNFAFKPLLQGRRLQHRPRQAGRSKKVFDFEPDALLDMAFGAPEAMHMPLPSTQKQEGNFGVGRHTVRRARALVADPALCIQEKKLQRAVELLDKDFTVRCVKLGWDETEIRMLCSLDRAKHLFLCCDIVQTMTRLHGRGRRSERGRAFACSACNRCAA